MLVYCVARGKKKSERIYGGSRCELIFDVYRTNGRSPLGARLEVFGDRQQKENREEETRETSPGLLQEPYQR